MSKLKLAAFVPPLLLMGCIFFLSSIPGDVDDGVLKILTDLDPQLQNMRHIPLFGLLQFLWLRAFGRLGNTERKVWLICLGITLGYGMLDEFHQLFVPGRYASLLDMLLNTVGAVLATGLFGWLVKKNYRTLL